VRKEERGLGYLRGVYKRIKKKDWGKVMLIPLFLCL
jgi:hypothetical protein